MPKRKRPLPVFPPRPTVVIDFLDQLYSRLMLRRSVVAVGEGTRRARARLAAHRAAQAERLKAAAPERVTRQQRRRAEILTARQQVTVAKRRASTAKPPLPGGSAVIRTPYDAYVFMGGL